MALSNNFIRNSENLSQCYIDVPNNEWDLEDTGSDGCFDIYELGDANTFKKIWNSKVYEIFRQSHIDGNLPKICKQCYVHNSGSNS